ncbi:unnamed protein product [Cladocopium goreaui]|uniref:Uncharacterized protein n=1 Tax=Cladocopium goreaui TaxID=2562237 RepID=A0A9P1BG75_9DINO|nr:unnamed protein product [Cladocopium goreaui]
MCMKCPAQSRGDAGLLYYNLGSCVEDGCRWVQEEYSLAGFIAKSLKDRNLCPLLQIYGFHPGCIRWCTMHALNLGILFTVNGGGLMLLMDLLYFGPRTFEEQLDTAYKSFVGFCRQHKIHHSQPPFTRRSVLRKTGEVGLVAKEFAGALLQLDGIQSTGAVLAHVCHDLRRYRSNPRYWHTFWDEDAMKWMKGCYP